MFQDSVRAGMAAFLMIGFGAAPGLAQSIAASLSTYQNTLKVASVSGAAGTSFSGAAFHPDTKTIYVVDDAATDVYELTPAGSLVRTISLADFHDPEGIAYQAEDYFLFSEEGLGNVVRIKLPRTGAGPVVHSSGTALNLASNLANSGIEGVAYRASDKTAFAVKEISPIRLYRIALDGAGNPTASFPDDPFSLAAKTGDAADIVALEDGNFIVVNQEQNRLEGYGPNGQALSTLSLGMNKPEGLAVDAATGTLYLVGEPREFHVFKKSGTEVKDPMRARGSRASNHAKGHCRAISMAGARFRGTPGRSHASVTVCPADNGK